MPLADESRTHYLGAMQPARIAQRLLRIAVAVTFGVMSLGHGPVMAFAKSETGRHVHQHRDVAQIPATHAHAVRDHAVHDHGAAPADDQPSPVTPDAPAVCYSFGCFAAVNPFGVAAPSSDVIPLAKLSPRSPDSFSPLFPEPVDPPPRLQV